MSGGPPSPGASSSISNELLHSTASTASASSTTSIPSTPGSTLPYTNEEMQAAAESPPPFPTTPDQTALFIEAYDCAKNNHNWDKVSSAVSIHPDWLTRIPTGLFFYIK